MSFNRGEKKGQVTIFIIVALVILLGVGLFLLFGLDYNANSEIPKSIEPAYTHFLSCLEENTASGISVLESKGGRIYDIDFEPGSSYMPFSNTLDFLGNPIPYWYYFSGNNLEKENVPSKLQMQEELAKFIEEKITRCSFENYYSSGLIVYSSNPKAKVTINDDKVLVDLSMPLSMEVGEDSVVINSHSISVSSSLGSLYNSAKEVYSYEQENLILEDYTIDILRLYAPVDGVLLSCAPKTWNIEEVFSNLKGAVESNIYSIRNKNGDYDLVKEENKYFVRDFGVPYDVRFLTSPNWSYTYEVTPANGNLLIATPVGNQAGLGIIGFCYVPYHFVYDIKYPVLVQISKGNEIFQFPLAVVISGNQPRKSLETSSLGDYTNELCQYMNTPMTINTLDGKLNPINANISFECVGSSCEIGSSSFVNGITANFPQCTNGILHAKAEGYVEAKKVLSTIESAKTDIILKKLHSLNLEIKIGGVNYSGDAIILFNSEDYSTTISYPSTKKIELAEGQYEVRVYIYKNSSLRIPSTAKEQCVDVPRSGLSGLFGLTDEKCFDITIPEQIVSNALSAGGTQNYYILDSELESARTLEIRANSLPTPTTLEQLQDNYLLFEENGMDINFK